MAPTDTSLVKVVHREQIMDASNTAWELTATLTRFGGLCVIVLATDDANNECWQGENILEARSWARDMVSLSRTRMRAYD